MLNPFYITVNGIKYQIEYSRSDSFHVIGLYERPFNAIKAGTKKTNTTHSPFDYSKIKIGDTIEFFNEVTAETLNTKVKRITKYSSARELLENEGTKNVLSSGADLEHGIINIMNLTGYKESAPVNGLYAIEIEIIKN